jgi:DNA polymerase III alpha subunit
MPYGQVDKLTKLVPQNPAKPISLKDAIEGEPKLQQAAETVMNDTGLIPIHFEVSTWATAKGLKYTPRTDQYTLATELKPVAK